MKGAPKKPEHLKKIPVGYKIPAWMDDALKITAKRNKTTQNALIEEGIQVMLVKYRI